MNFPAAPVLLSCVAMLSAMSLTVAPAAVFAQKPAGISKIVIDSDTGRTLYAANASQRRPPASLAKLMTLLLAFEALDKGTLKRGDRLVMTARGALQPASRLGLARGRSIEVQAALRTIAVISANDVAVALAGRLGGSEVAFVKLMNRRAAQIGMTQTRFGNATGLTPGGGLTTARDMTILARHIIRHHPEKYSLFATRSVRWNGWVRPNHNRLLGKIAGLDGLKTGYTSQAGFNLAASSRRGGRRIIVVVMGAGSAAARDLLVTSLFKFRDQRPSSTQQR